MGMVKEFKEFAIKGNLVDIAVAFVLGAAFVKIVTAFNEGIIMPLVGLLLGGYDLSKQKIILKEGTTEVKDASGKMVQEAVAEVSIKWGAFTSAVIDFLIVAFVMFLMVKAINRMRRKQEAAAPPEPSLTEKLLSEIRDALRK